MAKKKYEKGCLPKGETTVGVPVCRDKAGRFKKIPLHPVRRRSSSKKKKAAPAKKKSNWRRACKPKTMWKTSRGVCHCYTRGGGVKTVRRGARCDRVRRRKPPRHLR